MTPARISIRDLQVRRPGSEGSIYSGLNFDVPDGKVTGIFGPNGVGKSTLMRLFLGIKTGLQTNWSSAMKENVPTPFISNSPQNYVASLMPWLSVRNNIGLPLTAIGRPRHEIERAADELIENFSFARKDALPTGLSGGQQQIVALLRALVRLPDLLLLDEPFSALDIYTGAAFRDHYFAYIKAHKVSSLFVTHDSSELLKYCDYVLLLSPGNVAAEYDLSNPVDRHALSEKVLGRNIGADHA